MYLVMAKDLSTESPPLLQRLSEAVRILPILSAALREGGAAEGVCRCYPGYGPEVRLDTM